MAEADLTFGGRTILVTGGSRGIGFACARHLAELGATCVIVARHEEALVAARDELRQCGADVHAVAGDVADVSSVERVVRSARSHGPLSGVVHAAGVLGAIGTVETTDPVAWLDVVRINLFGTYLVTRAACCEMIQSGVRGSIVLLSGGGATSPFPNYTAYAAGKAGVVRIAETVAEEMTAHGIRVNALAPGFVATHIHDATIEAGDRAGANLASTRERLAAGGTPPAVAARAAAFLLSERSAGITGRLLAAAWDDWEHWVDHAPAISGSDLFTIRRIVPRDRGMGWQ